MTKKFIQKIASFALFLGLSFVIPTLAHAQIFTGTEFDEDQQYGICLGEVDLDRYPQCEGVDCTDPDFVENPFCISEAQAGTSLAGDSISSTGLTGTSSFSDFIIKLVNFALPYLALAAFLGYVAAGFIYVTAMGNDEQLGRAKKILIWSTVGLVIVILSFAITQLFTRDLVEGLN